MGHTSFYSEMSVKVLVETKIHKKKIMMFSKSTCPFCKAAKELLKKFYIDRGVVSSDDVEYMEIERHRDNQAIQTYLQRKTGQRTVRLIV